MARLTTERFRQRLERKVGALTEAQWGEVVHFFEELKTELEGKLSDRASRAEVDREIDNSDALEYAADLVEKRRAYFLRETAEGGWRSAAPDAHSRGGARRKARSPRRRLGHAATVAHSEALAALANQRRDVRGFRAAHLPDGYLTEEGVEQWIAHHSAHDGPPTAWLTDVPVPAGHRVIATPRQGVNPEQLERPDPHIHEVTGDASGWQFSAEPPFVVSARWGADGRRIRMLRYLRAGEVGDRSLPTTDGGVLDQLRGLSERLAEAYGWLPALATTFVLTGLVPYTSLARYRFRSGGVPGTTRIALEFDPSLSDREVLEAVKLAKQDLADSGLNAGADQRTRPQADRRYLLAAFCAAHDGLRWREQMRQWNTERPEFEYGDPDDAEHVRRFAKAARRARARLRM